MNLEQLRKLLKDITESQEALLKGATENGEVRAFNDIEDEEYKKLEKRASTVKEMIQRAEAIEADKAKVRDLGSPAPSTPHRVEAVREENHNEKGEYRGYNNFGEFLVDVKRAATPGETFPEKLKPLQNRSITGTGEQVGADGAFLVQTDFQGQLWDKTRDVAPIASRCESIEISSQSNALVWNAIDETSRATGSRMGGVQAYWRAEADTVASTKPKLRRDKLELEALMAVFYATDEILEDVTALGQLAEKGFTSEMAWMLDDAILNGNGAGKPLGIMNSPALVSVAKESSQAAASVVYANVRKMKNVTYPPSLQKAIILVGAGVMEQVEQMYLPIGGSTYGAPVFLPAGGVSGKPYGTIYGLDVIEAEQAQAVGTVGDILFLDLSQYRLIRKGGVQGAQSQHVRFLYGENVFRWMMRVNGKPLWNSPLTVAKGSLQRSPFVALATRS